MRTPLAIATAATLLTLTACTTTQATPESLDKDICDSLVYEIGQLDGKPVEDLDIPKLLAWINEDLQRADGVQPTGPFADSITMLQRVKDEPAQTRVLALDILTTRCIDAGHINL